MTSSQRDVSKTVCGSLPLRDLLIPAGTQPKQSRYPRSTQALAGAAWHSPSSPSGGIAGTGSGPCPLYGQSIGSRTGTGNAAMWQSWCNSLDPEAQDPRTYLHLKYIPQNLTHVRELANHFCVRHEDRETGLNAGKPRGRTRNILRAATASHSVLSRTTFGPNHAREACRLPCSRVREPLS